MRVIGIDPGLAGGIAVIGEAVPGFYTPVTVQPMPLYAGPKGRPAIWVGELRRLLATSRPCRVVAERGQTLPASMGGGSANFARGYGRGLIEGLCEALEIPLELVPPQTWQRELLGGTGDTKARSVATALRLFPGVSLLPTARSRKPSDGLADALLIAEWGRRRFSQGAAA